MFTSVVDEEINLCLINENFVPRYVRLAKDNFDYLSEWLAWPRNCKTEEDFKSFVKDSLHKYAERSSLVCAIEYKGIIIGTAGYNTIDFELKKVEIGYWIAADVQGKGIVTRVCKHLISYAFSDLKMDKVQISVAVGNVASRAVCDRLGMTTEGIITNEEKVGSRILDHVIYGLHRPEISVY